MNLAKGDYKASAPVKKSRKQFPYAAVIIIAVIFISAFFSRIRSASRYSALNSIPFWAAWGLLNASQGRHEGNWRNFNTGSGGFGGLVAEAVEVVLEDLVVEVLAVVVQVAVGSISFIPQRFYRI